MNCKTIRFNTPIIGLILSVYFISSSFAVNYPNVQFAQLPTGEIQRIAFGSCAKQWQHQTIWDTVLAVKPDLWLFLGDNIYGDTDGKTAWVVSKEQMVGEWNRLADKPEFQKARAQIPMMATWDNHDYGSHAGGTEFNSKDGTKKAFLSFWNEPEDSPRWKRPGIYDAKIFGPNGKRVQVILLDTKYNRSPFKPDPMPKEERLKLGKVGGYLPDSDPSKTHLGNEQWAWLEEQLKKPAELRLIVSSTQIIPDEKGMDEWGNFPLERKRLFDLVAKTNANGVILLSGNVHFGELSKIITGAYPLYELTSSGMTHINELYGQAPNQHRVNNAVIERNFGIIDIDWGAIPSPEITFKIMTASGKEALSKMISLDELRPSGWIDLQPMTKATQEIYPAKIGNQIVVSGGFGKNGPLAFTQIYDTDAQKWSAGPDLPTPLHHIFLVGRQDSILAIGGYEANQKDLWIMKKEVYVLEKKQSSWLPGPDLPEPRAEFAAGNVDGTIIVAGGRKKIAKKTGSRDDHTTASETFLLKRTAKNWEVGSPIPTGRMSCASAVLDDHLHILGGRIQTGKGISYKNVASHEAYDPKTDTWKELAPLPKELSGIAASVYGGKIYVFGGEADREPYEVYANVFVYDPQTNTWSEEPVMPIPLHGHGAVSMEGGIYIMGGSSTSGGSGTTAKLKKHQQ